MAKEFDIYLNKRLTECDIIVYSIPFRDGLTATNRMILESCLESYTLQKFIAVETGSELVSHIDKMIKTCNERLHMASTWSSKRTMFSILSQPSLRLHQTMICKRFGICL